MTDNMLIVDESAVSRINHLRTLKHDPSLMLRIRVDGGGCSGFQYHLELTGEKTENENIYQDVVISDDLSLSFLSGATVKFEEALVGSEFKIDNPNAVAGCGCGTSFAMKDD